MGLPSQRPDSLTKSALRQDSALPVQPEKKPRIPAWKLCSDRDDALSNREVSVLADAVRVLRELLSGGSPRCFRPGHPEYRAPDAMRLGVYARNRLPLSPGRRPCPVFPSLPG